MAALLKKRALAEFSQVLQQEEQVKQVKKLRLTKKAVHQGYSSTDLELLKRASPTEALELLINLSEAVSSGLEDVETIYKILVDHCQKEREPSVRAKVISVIRQLLQSRAIQPQTILDDLSPLLKAETSHTVIAQYVDCLHTVGSNPQTGEKLQQKVLQLIKHCLIDSSHLVKSKCMEVISDLTPVADHYDASPMLRNVGDFSRHQDPRVRTAALLAMHKLHQRGLLLDVSLYKEVCEALNDDYEGVRIAALNLLKVLSQIHSEHLVTILNSQEKIRLADDAFAKVCHMINDLSMNVRVQAASLLGGMYKVSLNFLEQTLDKKLMSNLRRKRSAHERQRENFESGEWSTGQKWADDAPKETVNAENVNLIMSGACGAFVHGLEDEFLEVRSPALDSLCELALQFPNFASLSLDFLVDMFNDEIEDVRLKAIKCLTRISNHIILREDQLETVLGVLEDFSMDIREALHEMLGSCKLSTKTGLKSCVDSLLENLKRYPQDKRSIWRCLQKLGAQHPYLTLPLVPELLGIHPYFDLPEPDVEDPAYISILILVFNATFSCPTMMPLLEQHTLDHYSYLSDTLPSLIPKLKLPNHTESPPERVSSSRQSRSFLQEVLQRVSDADCKSSSVQQCILETAIRDLQRLSEIEPTFSAAANCASQYIQCQLLLTKILSNKNWLSPSTMVSFHGHSLKSSLDQLLHLSFCLNHQFLGLRYSEMARVRQLRLRALALQLVVVIRGSNVSALGLCESFLEQVEVLQNYLEDYHVNPDSFTTSVFRELDNLEDPKPGSVARVLQPLLLAHPCPSFQLQYGDEKDEVGLERITEAKATIHEPSSESDNPLKFTAGLVLAVPLDAHIENVENFHNVRLKIKYPDQQTHVVLPRLADFRPLGNHSYRLYTSVLLSHNVWSEACHVEVSLVMDINDQESGTGLRSNAKSTLGLKGEDYLITLCKPVNVYIAPKQVKKGI
ncbi:integrator complex subunit 4 [Tachypleus tridentatus]|uniref:integrator complex subunit 4 n=1 Tax=Tachypleus tridentatus TaxID=6853 RepID=UPI003FD59667